MVRQEFQKAFFFFPPSFPENPSEPFGASVIIDGVTYGAGTASSKKLAKNKAGKVFSFSVPTPELFVCFLCHSGVLRARVIQYRGLALRTRE